MNAAKNKNKVFIMPASYWNFDNTPVLAVSVLSHPITYNAYNKYALGETNNRFDSPFHLKTGLTQVVETIPHGRKVTLIFYFSTKVVNLKGNVPFRPSLLAIVNSFHLRSIT